MTSSVGSSWSKSWSTLDKYGSSKVVLANATNAVIDVDHSVDGALLDLNLNKLLDRIGRTAASGFYRWRVRFLHDTARHYLKMSDESIGEHTRRLFGRGLSAEDLRELEAWDSRMAPVIDTSSADRGTVHRSEHPFVFSGCCAPLPPLPLHSRSLRLARLSPDPVWHPRAFSVFSVV